MRFFFPLAKVEENPDGTITVQGIASSEEIDADGEVVRANAIRSALPDFFRFGTGALREMHQPVAAGTVDEARVAEDGCTYVTATVVDPVAVRKVRNGVYKGFSVGGRVVSRDPADRHVITGVSLSEISLVDRPANPKAVINLWKGEDVTGPTEADTGTDAAGATGTTGAAGGAAQPEDAGSGATGLEKAGASEDGAAGADVERLEAEIARLAAERDGQLTKLEQFAGRIEPLAKAVESLGAALAEQGAALERQGAVIAAQDERLKRLEDQPETPKYERVRVVSKEDDGRDAEKSDEPRTPADAIRKALQNPLRMPR